jgi:glycosyltransferase involved in cell wall biosynthesis
MATDAGHRPQIRLAITYRVIWHWRMPIFQRLAASPEYDVCVFHGADFPGTKVVNAAKIEGVPHRQLLTIRIASKLRLPEWPICPFLFFRLWQFRPDVILAEGNSNLLNNLQMFCYALVTRTPVVFWTLGRLKSSTNRGLMQRFYRAVTCWMERRSAAVLGYSSRALAYFDETGCPREKQFRAVNVVDTDEVLRRLPEARQHVNSLRTELELDGCRVVLFVGAVIAAKRLEDLVDAFEIAHRSVPSSRLLIVGDGPYMPAIRSYIARSPVADKVLLPGRVVEGVSTYFLLGDVLVLPHLGGLAISEALAHGLPVIATEADGCEEDLIQDGWNGYLVPVGDRRVLAEKILALLSDDTLLSQMKQHAQEMIAEKHNVHTYLQGIKDAVNYASQFASKPRSENSSVAS